MAVRQRRLALILVGSACLATVGIIGRIGAANSVSLESGDSERATEDSFFDSLAAKDKSIHEHHHFNPTADPWVQSAKAVGSKARAHKKESMKQQFKQAQAQIAKEKKTMDLMDQHDKVKEEEQRTSLERMRAAREARKYEQHLDKLNDEVFPHASNDRVRKMLDATFSVRHALTDGEEKAHSKPLHEISGRVQAPANAKQSLRTKIQKKHAVHKGLKAATEHALVRGLLKPANTGKESSDHKPFDSILGPDSHPDSLHDEFKQYKHALDVTADAVYGDGEKASADAGAVDSSKSKAMAGEPGKEIKTLAKVQASRRPIAARTATVAEH